MGFSNMTISLSLTIIISSLLIQNTISINPLFTICSTSKNFTANSPYKRNLNKVFFDILFKTPRSGFGLASSGRYQDQAYALSLCRGDISTKDCAACVVEASSAVTKSCPTNRGAIVWYDNCYLKYSDNDFFGKIDNENKFYMLNVRNVSFDSEEFSSKTEGLLRKLSENASGKRKKYANGEVEVGGDKKVYGMVQCSRDLSRDDCKKCVDEAVSELPLCCEGKEGGRVVGGSCSIRYEIYPFLNL